MNKIKVEYKEVDKTRGELIIEISALTNKMANEENKINRILIGLEIIKRLKDL